MAGKTTGKSSSKSTSSRSKGKAQSRTGSSKSAAGPARFRLLHQLFKRNSRGSSKPPASTSKSRSNGAPARGGIPPARGGAGLRPVSTGLSLDRKLDIVGILMALLGLLTLLSLLSPSHSQPTGSWLTLLGRTFGWAAFIFPVVLLSVGLWLILRNFERVPQFSLERSLGLGLLYGDLLLLLQFLTLPADGAASWATASHSQGGGYVGAILFELFEPNIGMGGTLVVIAAWGLLALALALDMSIADLFRWAPPLITRIQDAWDDFRTRRSAPPLPTIQSSPVPALQQRGAPALPGQPGASSITTPQGVTITTTMSGNAQPVNYVLPAIDTILNAGAEAAPDDDTDRDRAHVIEETLSSFGAPVNVVEINRGPTITQFGVEPDFVETRTGRVRVRVGKIASLVDDLALALSARTIRVQAPVPGKGYVGIEVPNENIAMVALRDVLESEAFRRLKSPLRFAVGQDVAGNAMAADLSAMPHLLIAGATGSGKSVCVNTLICSLLLYNTPNDLRLVMVDPKRVELTGYNGIPHLLAPVVVEMERVTGALQWVLREMDMRYHKLAQAGSRNINDFNAKAASRSERKIPNLVVIIDELADLMMLAPDETEKTITRLAQLARATGIHLVIATQRPSVDVVTGLIKANFPARIAFAVASGVDSRVILDQPGAERLLGRGDMLFQAPDAPAPLRLQGTFVSDEEIQQLVNYWRGFAATQPTTVPATSGVVDALPSSIPLKQMPLWEDMSPQEDTDPLYNEAVDLVRRQGRASISMLQRRLRIGYTRSARIIEAMQDKGIIGTETTGVQGFEVLDYGPAAPPIDEQ